MDKYISHWNMSASADIFQTEILKCGHISTWNITKRTYFNLKYFSFENYYIMVKKTSIVLFQPSPVKQSWTKTLKAGNYTLQLFYTSNILCFTNANYGMGKFWHTIFDPPLLTLRGGSKVVLGVSIGGYPNTHKILSKSFTCVYH